MCPPCIERCAHFDGKVIAMATRWRDQPLHDNSPHARDILTDYAVYEWDEGMPNQDCPQCGAKGVYVPVDVPATGHSPADFDAAVARMLEEAR